MIYQFTFDEAQEIETQLIHLRKDYSEITSTCSSPSPQLPNNVPSTYCSITQLIAGQHEQMSPSGNIALQYPPTPPRSLIYDDDDDEVFTPIIGKFAQHVPHTPNRRSDTNYACN